MRNHLKLIRGLFKLNSNILKISFFCLDRPKKQGPTTDFIPAPSSSMEESKTIYKEVDFAKTIALNKTKRDIESEREQAISDQSNNSSQVFSPLGGGIIGSVGTSILSNR